MKRCPLPVILLFTSGLFFLPLSLYSQTILEDFESGTPWSGECVNSGSGIEVSTQIRPGGGPYMEEGRGESILGCKISVTDVYAFAVTLRPPEPLVLEGNGGILSLQVWSNNMDTLLTCTLSSSSGGADELFITKLNWYGWKEVSLYIPPAAGTEKRLFRGLNLYINPLELVEGDFYYYFDNIQIEGGWDR